MIPQPEIERTFSLVLAAALKGAPCPQNRYNGGPLNEKALYVLYRAGRLMAKISGRNYRQIDILTGLNAGRSTAADPHGRAPWKIIGANGAFRPLKEAA